MNCFLVILFALSTLGYCKGATTGWTTYDFSSLEPRQTPYIKQTRYVIAANNAYPYSVSYVEHPLPLSKTIVVAEAPPVKYPDAQALLSPDSQPQYLSIPKPLGAQNTNKYRSAQKAQVAPKVASFQAITPYMQEVETAAVNPTQEDLTYLAPNYIQPQYTLQPNVQEYPKQQNTPQHYQAPQKTRNYFRTEHINSPPVESPTETLFTPPNTYRFIETNPLPDYLSLPTPFAYRNY